MTETTHEPRPVHRCGASIDGPKIAAHVVAWRKSCRQRVKNPGDRCRFHDGSGAIVGVPREYRPGDDQ